MAWRAQYRRIVCSLGPAGVDRRVLRTAATFARLLELEMLGIFVEDQTVLGLAGLPFVRELRLPGYAWQPLEAERMAADLQAAAEQARLLLVQEGSALGVTCRFEVRRGDPATLAASLGWETDILVVAEPAAADRLAFAAVRAHQIAVTSSSAVLYLPSGPAAVLEGPVAALADFSTDPAFVLATRIASAANESLLVLTGSGGSFGDVAGGRVEVVQTRGAGIASVEQALGERRVRLIVLRRGASGLPAEAPSLLATRRNVPVLALESLQESATESRQPG